MFGRNRCEWRADDAPDDEGFSPTGAFARSSAGVERVVEMLQLPKKVRSWGTTPAGDSRLLPAPDFGALTV